MTKNISTHALREEGDVGRAAPVAVGQEFLPTPSARRATCTRLAHVFREIFLPTPSARRATFATFQKHRAADDISTHALREEGDRDWLQNYLIPSQLFLPTPSARRATWSHCARKPQ